MCNFWSCIVLKDKTVISEIGIDNHHELVEMFNLEDSSDIRSQLKFAKVEIVPPENDPFKPISEWKFEVDERVKPEWFSPAHEDVCWIRLKEVLKEVLITEDVAELTGRKGLFLKDCVVGKLTNSVVQKMFNSSVVQNMSDSSVVKRMSGSSVVQEMFDSSVVQDMSGSSVVVRHIGHTTIKDNAVTLTWDTGTANLTRSK